MTPPNITRYPLRKGFVPSSLYSMSNALSVSEISYLESLLKPEDIQDGKTIGENTKRNNVGVIWLRDPLKFDWLYAKLCGIVNEVNTKYFNMALTSIETLQFTIYTDDNQSYYGQHIDQILGGNDGTARKLTFVIQLSDPREYDGGDLQIYTGDDFQTPKNRGDIIFFNSRTLHEVTQVTRGMRKSLVGWVHGPIV